MDNIFIQAQDRSPRVDFRFTENNLSLEGESYPEDTATFFGPLLKALADFCRDGGDAGLTFDISLTYFNTSSAKVLMNMLRLLEGRAGAGAPVQVNWIYQEDDEVMREFGEDFARDVNNVRFELVETRS